MPKGRSGRMQPPRHRATAPGACALGLCPSSRELRGGASNRAHNPIMDTAPTELSREGVLDVLFAGVAIAVQQSLCGHDHAVRAVAALSSLLIDEGPLQR